MLNVLTHLISGAIQQCQNGLKTTTELRDNGCATELSTTDVPLLGFLAITPTIFFSETTNLKRN